MKRNWKEICLLQLFLWRVRWAVLAMGYSQLPGSGFCFLSGKDFVFLDFGFLDIDFLDTFSSHGVVLAGSGFCLLQWKGICWLPSWTPSQAMEQFLIAFCSTDSFLLDCLSILIPLLEGSHVLISQTFIMVLSWLQLSWLALCLDGFEVILQVHANSHWLYGQYLNCLTN